MGSARASSNLVVVVFLFFVFFFFLTFPIQRTVIQQKKWKMGVSIPLPADCEPTALPSELIPHLLS